MLILRNMRDSKQLHESGARNCVVVTEGRVAGIASQQLDLLKSKQQT